MSNLKSKIIQNKFLYSIAVFFSNGMNFFSNSKSVKGRGNSVSIHNSVMFKKVKINVYGHNNKVFIKQNSRLKNTDITIKGDNNVIELGEKIMVYESCVFLMEGNNSSIQIGNKTTIGSASIFTGESNTSLQIGEDCMISRQVRMNTSDFHSILEADTNKRINPPGNIFIGNHVWIGREVIIHKDSKILNNTIIGIRSFVNKSFAESNIIVAGTPAKKLKTGVTWSRDKIAMSK